MRTNNTLDFKKIVTSIWYRSGILLCLLFLLYNHFEIFYTQIWSKEYAYFWAFTHVLLSVWLLMKDNAFDKISSDGSVTVLTIALTYILHSNICNVDKYTFVGLNVFLMKSLVIMIVIAGLIAIIKSFDK